MSKGLVVALSGGVGGAKLALGLSRVLPADELLVVANTGDDFEHLGLKICPDIDTLTYVLAGLDNTEQGWGRRDETWSFMATIASVGGADWFRLGDRDLAMHVERTRRLRAGETLSQITADITRRLGIAHRILPMSDDPVPTRVRSDDGWIDFQDYFVRQQCRPVVRELVFDGAAKARPQPDVIKALGGKVRAVVICPSNPFISIEPILAVPGLRAAIEGCGAPVVAISPIVGGKAVKGPTAKMMQELGLAVTSASVAKRYGNLLDGYIVDQGDAEGVPGKVHVAPTLMTSVADQGSAGAHRSLFCGFSFVSTNDIWAVVPIKELDGAKQRLAPLLTPAQRRALIEVMMSEVLEAVTTTPSLAGVMVVTVDAHATALAKRLGARVVTDGARDGHTGSVTAGLKLLASEGRGAMLTLPADIPAVTSQEISLVVGAHLPGPSFTISPAHDHLGLQHRDLLAARRRAAALRRQQLLPASRCGAPLQHRADGDPSAGHRHGHRPSGRPRDVPAAAAVHRHAHAGLPRSEGISKLLADRGL